MINNKDQINQSHYKMIKIGLASPEEIRSWSYGEVTKPETINYKTLKPEKQGLFDERIFGPSKNYHCSCGKYKKIQNKGQICERCGVEITEAITRRQRMGHIELVEPVAHIWMLKSTPSRLSLLLDIKTKQIEEVIYFVSYIVLKAANAVNLKDKMVLDLSNAKSSEKTRSCIKKTLKDILKTLENNSLDWEVCQDLITDLADSSMPFSIDECSEFISKHTGAEIGIGARAIETLLSRIDLQAEIDKINKIFSTKTSDSSTTLKLIARLETLTDLLKSGKSPTNMILKVLPVIPPEIRPIIQLDSGRMATSEINDLYRRIIIRNNRLRKIKSIGAPNLVIHNEQRMLQEAVDAYIDNERKQRPFLSKDKRPLKSLTSILKGKQGRFRQNLLGKRVDFSGRSVIVVGPELKMYQCGLPREMAIILFKPFVIRDLIKNEIASNIKVADRMVEKREDKIWDILDKVVTERPVILNRAPTLHRLGIQGFEVVLVNGKAIRLHPLVTTAFNADFDGDQMAVHVPITEEAIAEVRGLMLGSKSILGPKDGRPIVGPTQDMVLGNYYLTQEELDVQGQGSIFGDYDEAVFAYQSKQVNLHAIIGIPVTELSNKNFEDKDQDKLLLTTVGKLIFNNIFKEKFSFINNKNSIQNPRLIEKNLITFDTNIHDYIKKHWVINDPLKKKDFSIIIETYFKTYSSIKTCEMLDKMKSLGFEFSDKSGTTVSAGDIRIYKDKLKLFKATENKIKEINYYHQLGMSTVEEKKAAICKLWENVKNQLQSKIETILKDNPKNPVFMMADSGARGNVSNFTQLIGMRGLMNNPKGETIEIPIKSSFREGLSMLEYFISTHGARKGFADIALKTADAGYLTRRLVDVAQGIIVTEEDCNPRKGFKVTKIKETLHNSTIVELEDRLKGRFNFESIILKNKEVIPANTLLTNEVIKKIVDSGIKEVIIRSVLTCDSKKGICLKCYGINLATGNLVEVGDIVGVIAAQSIGEPGTQLTMRTFHTGGVAGESDITQGLPRIKELLDVTHPKGTLATISEIYGKVIKIVNKHAAYTITIKGVNGENHVQNTPFNVLLRVKVGDDVEAGDKLSEGAIDIKALLLIATATKVENYILKEAQKVYRLQGIEISDKYLEIIIKQMLARVQIENPGDSKLLKGSIVNKNKFRKSTIYCIKKGLKPPYARQVIFGIKKAPLKSDSFLSAASFQDTTRVLVKAVIKGEVDYLRGLKENIMLGNLIPAGTALKSKEEILQLGLTGQASEY